MNFPCYDCFLLACYFFFFPCFHEVGVMSIQPMKIKKIRLFGGIQGLGFKFCSCWIYVCDSNPPHGTECSVSAELFHGI